MSNPVAYSVCPHDCPSTCALDVELAGDNRIGAVRGAEAHRYTDGVICAKVARYAERVHHPGRLTRPLRRTGPKGSGEFAPISWDEALDELADAFRDAAARDGAEAVWPYYYAGTMGLLQRDGINRLRHVMGYSRQLKTICASLIQAGWRAGVGDMWCPDTTEVMESDLIVVWGGNPVYSQVNLMRHISAARKLRDAKLVVVDPYRTPTAAQADLHIALRPGTDGALACAMMHVLLAEGLADKAYMRDYSDYPDGLEAHLAERSPEWAAPITGLGAEDIRDFARLYGRTPRSMIRIGYGFTRSRNGAANAHAVTCLPTVTGAWRHKGGGALYSLGGVYGLDMRMIEGTDAVCKTRVLDMSRIGAVLTGDTAALRGGPPVTAMLIQNTNPMAVAPESGLVHDGFRREDLFVCVHEQFMTETAAMADIVLPATTFLEHDDLYVAAAHGSLQIGPKAIDPPGEARSNHDLLCALAPRLGAEHPGFGMTAWEVIDWTLQSSGHGTADELKEKRWLDCHPSFDKAHFLDGFPTADGRFHFAPDWSAVGPDHAAMPRLPDHFDVIDESDGDHPFRLVTAPSRHFLNTSFTETPTSRRKEGHPTVKMHPDDCHALGVDAGDRVRLGNTRGSVVVRAEPFDGLQRGIAVVESVWPNAAFEEGIGINLLTSDDPAPPSGGAVFHDTAIWVKAA